jgi:hypothetical protein
MNEKYKGLNENEIRLECGRKITDALIEYENTLKPDEKQELEIARQIRSAVMFILIETRKKIGN